MTKRALYKAPVLMALLFALDSAAADRPVNVPIKLLGHLEQTSGLIRAF